MTHAIIKNKKHELREALSYLDKLEYITVDEIREIAKILNEDSSWIEETQMWNFIKDLTAMTPLIAHMRFISFRDDWGEDVLPLVLYWWHCKLLKQEPRKYGVKEYNKLLDPTRLESLKENNWGIDFK